jgi:type II secretory pathway pseudopilin PulG
MSLVIAVCAVVGAIAGIAGSAAAPSKSKSSAQSQKKANKQTRRALKHAFRGGMRPGGPGPGFFLGGPVHAEAVVPNKDGTGFVTVTEDSGVLSSVDGTTLHIKEGTDKATYKDDAAVDVGSDAKVLRNHATAKLSDLKSGDHVHVITGGPQGNIVVAEDDATIAQDKKDHDKWGGHHRFGPGGPPPGGPGAPGGYPGDQGGSNQNGSDSGSGSSSSSS